jgi:hypothetical protein
MCRIENKCGNPLLLLRPDTDNEHKRLEAGRNHKPSRINHIRGIKPDK